MPRVCQAAPMSAIVHRQCTLCEAHCGIAVTVEGDRVLRIEGDPEDHQSKGYICPKAAALADLYTDPDRLTKPVRRTADGWEEMEWDAALDFAADGLRRVRETQGTDSLATYVGNPTAHSWSLLSVRPAAGDDGHPQPPLRHLHRPAAPAPHLRGDVRQPGAVPDPGRRPHGLHARHRRQPVGVQRVADDRPGRAAPAARRHRARWPRRRRGPAPHGDGEARLAARRGPPGRRRVPAARRAARRLRRGPHRRPGRGATGPTSSRRSAAEWDPERAAAAAGVDAATITALARDFAAAERAVAYGRVGVCQQRTGTVIHWLINALNAVTGNLDAEGGAMFPESFLDLAPALRLAGRSGPGGFNRYTQRVSGMPEMNGELPIAGLADEITTPGAGQVRGPARPRRQPGALGPGRPQARRRAGGARVHGRRRPVRHGDLPPRRRDPAARLPARARRDGRGACRSCPCATTSASAPRRCQRRAGGKADWEILNGLTTRLGRGLKGRGLGVASRVTSPARIVEAALLAGPYGLLRRGPLKGLTLWKVKRARHGIDLGPLRPGRLPGALLTKDRRVQLAPRRVPEAAAELEAIAAERETAAAAGFDLTLIGRRNLRSNNSWMHNSSAADQGPRPLHRAAASRRRRPPRPRRRRRRARRVTRRRDRGARGDLRRDAPGRRLRPARLRARQPRRRRLDARGGAAGRERQRHHRPHRAGRPDGQRGPQRGAGSRR